MEWSVEGQGIGGQTRHVKPSDCRCWILILIPKAFQSLSRELRLGMFVPISLLKKIPIRFPHPPGLTAMARHAQCSLVVCVEEPGWIAGGVWQ